MGQVRHGSATTTHAVRAAMQRSQASLTTLKGGTGRTTLTKALAMAMAFVAKGRRVLIVDGTDGGLKPVVSEVCSLMEGWRKSLLEDGLPDDALEIRSFATDAELEDLLTRAWRHGVDIALVDTSRQNDDRLMACLHMADLILVPFVTLAGAKAALKDVTLPTYDIPLVGVACALSHLAPTREEMSKALGEPVLRTTLPNADLFSIMFEGRIDRLVADLDELDESRATKLATRDAWYRTLDLSTEVEWLLDGLALKPRDPRTEYVPPWRIVGKPPATAA